MRLCLVALAFAFSASTAAAQDMVPVEAYTHPQILVAMDGARHLNVFCIGEGSPTVLLDSGLNGFSIDWAAMQKGVAKFTRVCSYDRAGWGFSDPPTAPMDVTHITEDLHRLIVSKTIGGPVIYVGHSIAGLYGVGLAGRHPDDVLGEVLVDPSSATLTHTLYDRLPPKIRQAQAERNLRLMGRIRDCAAMALRGQLLAPQTDAAKACLEHETAMEPYNDALRPLIAARVARPGFYDSLLSEMESNYNIQADSPDEKELAAIPPGFGDKPLIVLSAGVGDKWMDWETDAEVEAIYDNWLSGHAALAKLSSRGVHRAVPDSGHYIHIDQPAAVIDAVREMVEAIRGATP